MVKKKKINTGIIIIIIVILIVFTSIYFAYNKYFSNKNKENFNNNSMDQCNYYSTEFCDDSCNINNDCIKVHCACVSKNEENKIFKEGGSYEACDYPVNCECLNNICVGRLS